jgi:hypothetical protein
VIIRFDCPTCETPARLDLSQSSAWHCPACDHTVSIDPEAGRTPLTACVLCGTRDLYRKKDFPHRLGMAILILACVLSFITYGWYEWWLTWSILLGTALFDGLLYLLVGDVVVCYRCQTQHRRFVPHPSQQPFDLGVNERYRQERIRREQLRHVPPSHPGTDPRAREQPERKPE